MRPLLWLLCLCFLTQPLSAQTPGTALSEFGFAYFREAPGDGNIVCSPLSIHAAFCMLALGADGETKSEAEEVLKLQVSQMKTYNSYVEALTPQVGQFQLASKIWPAQGLTLSKSYLQTCRAAFGATPQNLNYHAPEAARRTINRWVAEKTQEEIEELLPPGSLDPSVALVLSNALYFKGSWSQAFPEKNTKPAAFHTPAGDVEVPMMRALIKTSYFQNDQFKVLSLPYEGSRLALAVILPRTSDDWDSSRQKLNADLLKNVAQYTSDEESDEYDQQPKIWVRLPKFKIRQTSQPLAVLMSMGLTHLLGPSPDLSKLTQSQGLSVSKCFHEAVVDVDEKGTEASAATAIVVTRSMNQKILQFTVDRPFFFAIYDRETLAPLFLGQVTNPLK